MFNVLVPTDFSENAQKAADYAIWLFQGKEMKLFLFNAYGMKRSEGSMLISIDDILQREAKSNMARETKRVKDLASPGMVVEGFTRNCTLANYIQEVVDDWSIDLIVLGTQGESGLKGKIFGSNASNVIKEVSVPTIAVPLHNTFDDGGEYNIGFGSDLKPFKGRDAINKLLDHMRSDVRKVSVELFYITHHSKDISSDKRQYFKEMMNGSPRQFTNIIAEDIETGVADYIKKRNPDLIMLIQRRDSFINRLLGHSVSHQLLLKAEIPMLVVKE